MGEIDVALTSAASRGLTGADLKAVVEDGKLLFAYDNVNALPLRRVEDYVFDASQIREEERTAIDGIGSGRLQNRVIAKTVAPTMVGPTRRPRRCCAGTRSQSA